MPFMVVELYAIMNLPMMAPLVGNCGAGKRASEACCNDNNPKPSIVTTSVNQQFVPSRMRIESTAAFSLNRLWIMAENNLRSHERLIEVTQPVCFKASHVLLREHDSEVHELR